MKVCRVATVPFAVLHHLGEQLAAIARGGHEVWAVCSDGPEMAGVRAIPGVAVETVRIPRSISPGADLRALVALYRCFRRADFDLVHSMTPKAGLLCALAAWLAGVPIRLHTFTGQVWAEQRGPGRWIGKFCDRLIVRLNSGCYADSPSQRDFIVAEGIAPAARLRVLRDGSIAGVDLRRFRPEARAESAALRRELGIGPQARIVTFVGRVTRAKGVVDLVAAFAGIADSRDLFLLLVGPFEPELDPLPAATARLIAEHPRIRALGYQAAPERFVAAADLFCLPSYREGFGTVVIEAAAMGIPAVATRIVGLVDAVEDGVTGILVPPRDQAALAAALARLLDDAALSARMGAAAAARSRSRFAADLVNAALVAEYARLADTLPTGRRAPRPPASARSGR